MNLNFDPNLALNYKGLSQRARVMSQGWTKENLYCPVCSSESIEPTREGTPVIDFICPECNETFQLKSQSRPFSTKITDGAYKPMMDSISNSKTPNFLFLHYKMESLSVNNLFAVPKHFFFPEMIEKRNPLRFSARRAGHVLCNLLLYRLPEEGKILVVRNGIELDKFEVRKKWESFKILSEIKPETRGWTTDVLSCVRKLDKRNFKLSDVYSFESELSVLHPENKNVQPKIRQQLQILRDMGILEFLGNGIYRLI